MKANQMNIVAAKQNIQDHQTTIVQYTEGVSRLTMSRYILDGIETIVFELNRQTPAGFLSSECSVAAANCNDFPTDVVLRDIYRFLVVNIVNQEADLLWPPS